MKTQLFLSCIIIIIILSYGCSDKSNEEIVTPNMKAIEYLSFKSQGCQASKILTKTNDVANAYWDYVNDSLFISTTFTTHCSAIMKDSAIVTENKIEIYLWDTNNHVARCTCSHLEEFVFKAESPKTIEIIIYYKAIYSNEFTVIACGTIKI